MMQSADLLYLDHIAKRGRLNRSAGRGIFVKGQMRTAVLVVLEIVPQYTAQASSVENDDVFLAFTSNRTDQALDVRVLPMRLRSRKDFAYGQPFCGLTKLSSIGAISISQQVTRSAVPIFDRDAKYGLEVPAAVRSLGVNPVRTSFESPWQNGVAERWVGSCRRELLDHIIAVDERHLRRLLSEYIRYNHEDRTLMRPLCQFGWLRGADLFPSHPLSLRNLLIPQ